MASFVTTSEGYKCKSIPTASGLYAMNVEKDTDRCIFSDKIYDNGTDGGRWMCHVGIGIEEGKKLDLT